MKAASSSKYGVRLSSRSPRWNRKIKYSVLTPYKITAIKKLVRSDQNTNLGYRTGPPAQAKGRHGLPGRPSPINRIWRATHSGNVEDMQMQFSHRQRKRVRPGRAFVILASKPSPRQRAVIKELFNRKIGELTRFRQMLRTRG